MVKFRKSFSSAFKIVSFVVFVVSAWLIGWTFLGQSSHIWQVYGYGDVQTWNFRCFVFALVVIWTALFVHLLRIYVTLRMLEDPTSEKHQIYLRDIRGPWKSTEQFIRILIIAVVCFKLFKKFDTLNVLAWYLLTLYGLLLLWDILIYVFYRFSEKNPQKTFWRTSFLGLFASITLLYFTSGECSLSQKAKRLAGHANRFHNQTKQIENIENIDPYFIEEVSALNDSTDKIAEKAFSISKSLSSIAKMADRGFVVLTLLLVLSALLLHTIICDYCRNKDDYRQYIVELYHVLSDPYYGDQCKYSKCDEC